MPAKRAAARKSVGRQFHLAIAAENPEPYFFRAAVGTDAAAGFFWLLTFFADC